MTVRTARVRKYAIRTDLGASEAWETAEARLDDAALTEHLEAAGLQRVGLAVRPPQVLSGYVRHDPAVDYSPPAWRTLTRWCWVTDAAVPAELAGRVDPVTTFWFNWADREQEQKP